MDYSDVNWHSWDSVECPVHPKSVIQAVYNNEHLAASKISVGCVEKEAGMVAFGNQHIVAFRVIKPYVEPPKPREFWINEYDCGLGGAFESKAYADERAAEGRIRCIRVREVLE